MYYVIAQSFAVVRHLQQISRLLSPSALKTVVVALVIFQLAYVNSRYMDSARLALLQHHITEYVSDVTLWMQSNLLQLNTEKTKGLWCS